MREAVRADGADPAQARNFDRRARAASVPGQASPARGAETQPRTVEAAAFRGGAKEVGASAETLNQSGDEKPRAGDVLAAGAAAAPVQQNGEAREAASAEQAAGTRQAERPESASAQLVHSTARALARGENTFKLRLRPEGMGEVSVTIHARERDLSLSIRASSETTRTLILSQIDDLRSGLSTGDYRLGELSVEVNANGYGGAGSSAASQEQEDARPRRASRKVGGQTAEAAPERAPQTRAGAIMYRI
jgi:flagellar hook-length control protein FliK